VIVKLYFFILRSKLTDKQ